MFSNITGNGNIAVGVAALHNLASGDGNVAIGHRAGLNASTGTYNLYLSNVGAAADESNTTRIGSNLDPIYGGQTRAFIAGIRSVTTANADATPILIDSAGQLGTASSSRRVKRDIEDMGDTTLALHPVRFRYQAHTPDSPLQYGLIAEEVAEIAPDLVARNKDGEIETVYYDKVNAMLLNEVQKLSREVGEQREINHKLESRLVELKRRLE